VYKIPWWTPLIPGLEAMKRALQQEREGGSCGWNSLVS
jgi:hypothetical protein